MYFREPSEKFGREKKEDKMMYYTIKKTQKNS